MIYGFYLGYVVEGLVVFFYGSYSWVFSIYISQCILICFILVVLFLIM